jgi:hypothetical protein
MLGGVRSVALRDELVSRPRAFTTRDPDWLHHGIYILDEDRLTARTEIDPSAAMVSTYI